jgi:hypothetical protein
MDTGAEKIPSFRYGLIDRLGLETPPCGELHYRAQEIVDLLLRQLLLGTNRDGSEYAATRELRYCKSRPQASAPKSLQDREQSRA